MDYTHLTENERYHMDELLREEFSLIFLHIIVTSAVVYLLEHLFKHNLFNKKILVAKVDRYLFGRKVLVVILGCFYLICLVYYLFYIYINKNILMLGKLAKRAKVFLLKKDSVYTSYKLD